MNRLTHKRENGIKHGCWSPNKKQELVDRLAMYENREELLMSELEKEADKANDMISVCERELCQYYDGFEDGVSKAIEIVKVGIADAEDANDANVPGKWIPCSERLPEDESYILVSFENSTMPDIARYEENDEGGTFYPGDDEKSYSSYGFFANAWMPLPEPYREV